MTEVRLFTAVEVGGCHDRSTDVLPLHCTAEALLTDARKNAVDRDDKRILPRIRSEAQVDMKQSVNKR